MSKLPYPRAHVARDVQLMCRSLDRLFRSVSMFVNTVVVTGKASAHVRPCPHLSDMRMTISGLIDANNDPAHQRYKDFRGITRLELPAAAEPFPFTKHYQNRLSEVEEGCVPITTSQPRPLPPQCQLLPPHTRPVLPLLPPPPQSRPLLPRRLKTSSTSSFLCRKTEHLTT
jgi:hypothetical protein